MAKGCQFGWAATILS